MYKQRFDEKTKQEERTFELPRSNQFTQGAGALTFKL